MSSAEKISSRLPHFYVHWDKESLISNTVDSIGKRLDESEKEFIAIMRCHWVDTAGGTDLDRLGAIFRIGRNDGEPDNDYRGRLKAAVISYKGGGTIGAIKTIVRVTLGLPQDYPVEIIENPPVALNKTWNVRAGKEWTVNPRNINDTVPVITIKVETENARISDPTITNVTTGESITFTGDMHHGDILRISDGVATLNGSDETPRLSTTKMPSLPRRRTTWKYTEAVGANIGVFDSTKFDESVFAIDIISSVTFEWVADQPATFELRVPEHILMKAGMRKDYLQEMLESVKASGVKAEVKVI
ncbi:hypothetical protein CUJ83_04900 [Methanocella sp. CWC-04]|uniref:Uncharacterized protein n=1 Tax=Methanooceanicella nereidis TaxID=2052831 RepID=A0AAP2RCH5_9EURY|nr:hypothetical protein [Methanocella sp. CWC-04]MCD1294336.1 hypothetical protein [Methanocella sp. CWC-04]